MTTLTLDVAPLAEALDAFAAAFDGVRRIDAPPRIGVASPEILWSVLAPARWDILRAMADAGKLKAADIAGRVDRDVRSVEADMAALLAAGILQSGPNDTATFPFEAIHVDFVLKAA